MKRTGLRRVLAAAIIGIGLHGLVADAGLRHFRIFRSGCSAPTCSAPMYVVAPAPVCACCRPMPTCSRPSCFGPTCAIPACSAPMFGQPGYAGQSMLGYPAYGNGMGMSTGYPMPGTGFPASQAGYSQFGPGIYGAGGSGVLDNSSYYGSTYEFGVQPGVGMTPGYPQMTAYDVSGLGSVPGSSVPSYYAPVPSVYTPVPPAPATDLVW
jgi:hypothetical protein